MLKPFTSEVIETIRAIPAGRVSTYGAVAAMAGNPRAARQVARILHACSEKEALPWWRVVNREGRISLRPGCGYEEQEQFLLGEGGLSLTGRAGSRWTASSGKTSERLTLLNFRDRTQAVRDTHIGTPRVAVRSTRLMLKENEMRTIKAMLVVLCCVMAAGIARANTLKDRPPTIFYPEGHYLEGSPRTVHRDMYGYNYYVHKFIGSFANAYLGFDGYPPYRGNTAKYLQGLVIYGYGDTVEAVEAELDLLWYWELRDVHLNMRWNDAWLSNQDRGDDAGGTEPDGNLDRHYGFPSYFDSGAELIQHQRETYDVEVNGKIRKAQHFYYSKIVAVPGTAVLVDGIWYTEDGDELGPVSYGQFAKVRTWSYDTPVRGGKPCKDRSDRQDKCDRVRPDAGKDPDHAGGKPFWKKDHPPKQLPLQAQQKRRGRKK